jgi:membrane protein YqaA with SNARE-associated domain
LKFVIRRIFSFLLGIHVTIAATLLGGAIGYFIHSKNEEYYADRDAVLRHYVKLHPEDFVPKGKMIFNRL